MNSYKFELNPLNKSKILKSLLKNGFVHLSNVIPKDKVKQIDTSFLKNVKIVEGLLETPMNILPICFADGKQEGFEDPVSYSGMKRSWYYEGDRQFKSWFWKNPEKLPNDVISALERHGIVSLVKDYFNDSVVTSYSLNTVRNLSVKSNPDYLKVHQDMTHFTSDPKDHKFLTVWIPLHDCGDDSPGLKIYKKRFESVFETNRELANRCMSDEEIESLDNENFYCPNYEAGDVVIFLSMVVHGTHLTSNMKYNRRSADMRFFPKSNLPKLVENLDDGKLTY